MMSSGPDLSNIPLDILSEIIRRLEVPDFLRSGAVCTTWSNLSSCRKYCKKIQIPWLMFSSRDKVDYHRYFYSMTEKKKKNYQVYLPDIGDRHCIGSSQGFLISVDKFADLHATNPITGTHIPLPPTSNSPGITGIVTDPKTGLITHYIQRVPHQWMQLGVHYDPTPVSNSRYCHYIKVILSPSTDIAVAIYGAGHLAYARVGDNNWTALITCNLVFFEDATFHTGRLHAITTQGTIAIFDDLDGGKSTFVSPEGPLSNDASSMRYLVESSDGEDLFLVYKKKKTTDTPTAYIRVFLLDKTTYTWKQMTSLGDVALFLGINHSMSLCTREYPGLKRDSVYFTDDKPTYLRKRKLPFDMGVFNLEDGRIEPIYVGSNIDRLDRSPPIWFMPTLS